MMTPFTVKTASSTLLSAVACRLRQQLPSLRFFNLLAHRKILSPIRMLFVDLSSRHLNQLLLLAIYICS